MERRPGGEVIETAREARQGYLDRPVCSCSWSALPLPSLFWEFCGSACGRAPRDRP
jgi:hypothetical protein